MADTGERGSSKRERREARRRAGRRRKLRNRLLWGGPVAVLLTLLVLWQFNRLGPAEVVQAEVVHTRIWSHRGNDGRNHSHQRVTLEIEGLVRTTLERGDGLERGQTVPVRIRRGRLTGRPIFIDREQPGAGLDETVPSEPLEEPG